ncbi:MAG: pyridoxal phosphate-dependent aminotransferase [Saprospiraceae bacterium]
MIIQPASRLGEVKEYYFSIKLKQIAKMRAAGAKVLNLGIGSPDLPPSTDAVNKLVEAANDTGNHAYQSYVGLPELREGFAAWYAEHFGVKLNPNGEVMPLIGSKEGIMHISMTFLEKGDQVLIPNPGYPAYRAVANLTGAEIMEYKLSEENGWYPDLAELAQRDLTKVKIMWINYPHMPTGTRAKLELFKELIAFAKKHQILLVNDNPYSFILNDQPTSLLAVEGAKEVALELNSLSKSHNMAGWRVGVLGGKSDYLQAILRFKSNMDSGMFKPVQLAAVEALKNPRSWYDDLNVEYRQRREVVFQLLDEIGAAYDRDQVGMFVWAKKPTRFKTAYDVSDYYLEKSHVFITPGSIFGSQGDDYIRISLCSKAEVFQEAIERVGIGEQAFLPVE